MSLGRDIDAEAVRAARADGWEVVLATGSRPFPDRYRRHRGPCAVIDALDPAPGRDAAGCPAARSSSTTRSGTPSGSGMAEWLAGHHGRVRSRW